MSLLKKNYFLFTLFLVINQFLFINSWARNRSAATNETNNNPDNSDDIYKEQEKTNKQNEFFDGCEDIEPTNGIKDCIDAYQVYNGENCCYMTIKYDYNEFNICVRISKNKDKIKKKIEEIERDYEDCESVDIDCYSKIIKYSFMFLSIFLLL